ncbi:response regulator [Aliikangiella maris]|uniref:Response regulator n=2 Tax=Aliikangiella maris TaxID=3162458 RepID=A0ABV3MLJ7_9GAMM
MALKPLANDYLIYCIDDNQEILDLLQEQLGDRYNIQTFIEPQSAIDRAILDIPDLIICDLMMPTLSGYDVLEQIRRHQATSHIPIVMLSARSDNKSKLKSLSLMADDFITKPIDRHTLCFRIDSLLSIRQLVKARFAVHASSPRLSEPLTEQAQPITERLNIPKCTRATTNQIDFIIQRCAPEQKPFLQKFVTCIQSQLGNSHFNLGQLSQVLHLSDSQICRKVKAISGFSPQEILKIIQLETAANLVSQGESLKSIAIDCGFSS